jgi:hypothetical protein
MLRDQKLSRQRRRFCPRRWSVDWTRPRVPANLTNEEPPTISGPWAVLCVNPSQFVRRPRPAPRRPARALCGPRQQPGRHLVQPRRLREDVFDLGDFDGPPVARASSYCSDLHEHTVATRGRTQNRLGTGTRGRGQLASVARTGSLNCRTDSDSAWRLWVALIVAGQGVLRSKPDRGLDPSWFCRPINRTSAASRPTPPFEPWTPMPPARLPCQIQSRFDARRT